ncbi:MAG: AAA family ATPase [Thermoplasmatales archaeon]|nr:AAA family ATPase [Thermoplasmatales archaeon]
MRKRNNIVKNRKILQNTHIPEQLPHRKEQIDKIASVISIALSGEKPSNIMVYGKTGTGKTATLHYIGKELKKADPKEMNCSFIYVNCEVVDTPYGVLYNIGNQVTVDPGQKIPFTGWSFEKVYSVLVDMIDNEDKVYVVVLDEIDRMVFKKGDDIFYYLTKINENLKKSKVSLVGISNDMKFLELLEPKARSRLGGESLVFPPYSKLELEDILQERADIAFDPNSIDKSVIPYCAAIAARVDGDARIALDLLRTAADIAERNGDSVITDAHVKSAKNSIEFDVVSEAIKTLSSQSKVVLMSIMLISEKELKMTTGDVYTKYSEISDYCGLSRLTQRRVTDLISELDMMGIINASVKSFGCAGRTKEIELSVPKEMCSLLKNDPLFKNLDRSVRTGQTKLI